MNKGKLIAGVALVFIVGMLVGSVGTRLYFRHHHPFFPGFEKMTIRKLGHVPGNINPYPVPVPL